MGFELFYDLGVCEHALDRRLRVVKVPPYARDVHVGALLGHHLSLLHCADAAFGIKYDDFRPFHVTEAFQRRLARVAARRHEDESAAAVAELLLGRDHKIRQQGERHILERVCGAVPQFQHEKPVLHFHEGARVVAVEAGIRLAGIVQQFFVREFVEILFEHGRGAFGIIHRAERVEFFVVQNRERRRNDKSAVIRDAFNNRFRGGVSPHTVARTDVFHCSP